MKDIKVSKTFVAIILAIAAWAPFAYQRAGVLAVNEVPLENVLSDMTGVKYILGLSYSAEEMAALIEFRNALK